MLIINSLPSLIDEKLVKRAKILGSAELCDGMTKLGIKSGGAMSRTMLPLNIDDICVGTATTVETSEGNNFPIHVAVYQGMPGYVLVIDGKNYDNSGYIGDLIVGAADAIGYEGIVIDGCVRDRKGLLDIGLPVYSQGYMQGTPPKVESGQINTTIKCGGIEVAPGDLIVGDCDGITVIPKEHIEDVIIEAEKKQEYEHQRREIIKEYKEAFKKGGKLPEIMPEWVAEKLK
ncbi:RraA family protein [Peptoniphilus porci]|uniref:Putative 4-hydroxy-4-methyl-2-oxoglutarate aldolase n=1 Tax=Peptoniphilus porci TaxID=2652280 RepID=A0A1U7M0P5_9FIRM|nr:RraA family protein [Peptoniphilus porci]OLR65229.1 S-adenosylmethionine--2-demethylmenaquinone methyltransferase [Peptoniphilus porci]